MLKNHANGFTLVELAIVMVIMGLMVAGVIAGKDLIKTSEMRALIRQYEEFQTGTTAFIEKYNAIPGDVNGVKFALKGGCDNNSNGGNSNGVIEDKNKGSNYHNGEISCFWSNLTTEGKEFIQGSYEGIAESSGGANDIVGLNMPKMRNSNFGWGVFSSKGKNYYITGVKGNQGDNSYLTENVFIPVDAYNIDIKIDDGVPSSGTIQARGSSKTSADGPNIQATSQSGASKTSCINTAATPNEYQFSADSPQCNLRFDMPSS